MRKEGINRNKKKAHAAGIFLGIVWYLWPCAQAPQTPSTTEGLSGKRVREEVMMESLTPN